MRRRKAKKIATLPDPKFNDVMVTKFVNNIMLQGKKGTAFTIFYDAIEKVATKTQEDGIEVWRRAVENVTPAVEVRSRRVGGATFQIPSPIRDERKNSWIQPNRWASPKLSVPKFIVFGRISADFVLFLPRRPASVRDLCQEFLKRV
jgi:ribosomal protein S7